MKRAVLFLLVFSPSAFLWADTLSSPAVAVPTKVHHKKHSTKHRRKKSVNPDPGTNASQEEVTDQHEVSQQANSSDKHQKK